MTSKKIFRQYNIYNGQLDVWLSWTVFHRNENKWTINLITYLKPGKYYTCSIGYEGSLNRILDHATQLV